MTRIALALLLLASSACAQPRCTTHPAVGGGTITTCVEGAVVRTCTTRPAVGGGTITTCR